MRGYLGLAELTFSEVGEWCFISSTTKEWTFEKISQRIYDLALQSFTPLRLYFHPSVESIFVGAARLGGGELRLNCSESNSTSKLHLPSSKPKEGASHLLHGEGLPIGSSFGSQLFISQRNVEPRRRCDNP